MVGFAWIPLAPAVDPETGRYTNMPLTVDVLRRPVTPLTFPVGRHGPGPMAHVHRSADAEEILTRGN